MASSSYMPFLLLGGVGLGVYFLTRKTSAPSTSQPSTATPTYPAVRPGQIPTATPEPRPSFIPVNRPGIYNPFVPNRPAGPIITPIDPDMPQSFKDEIESLRLILDPAQHEALANKLASFGYHDAANAERARAANLREWLASL